jgi:ring-1,2-phenylacetyl-CoA epoxidase subunit PaaC
MKKKSCHGEESKIMNNTSNQHPNGNQALIELLFQLADDDFILAYRGSEWLGLAPHIEEDVAFSSISQDTMGHSAMFYQLLESLNVGDADHLAHSRPVNERRNAVLLEKVNGPGHYLVEPRYDWAFAVVRNYFYVAAKKVKMESLKTSSYQPLADVAIRVNLELYYHHLHWKTWFIQLVKAGGEARTRMIKAIHSVAEEMDGIFELGPLEQEMVGAGLIVSSKELKQRWFSLLGPVLEDIQVSLPALSMVSGNGRMGEHTDDLEVALQTLKEVYQLDPHATW